MTEVTSQNEKVPPHPHQNCDKNDSCQTSASKSSRAPSVSFTLTSETDSVIQPSIRTPSPIPSSAANYVSLIPPLEPPLTFSTDESSQINKTHQPPICSKPPLPSSSSAVPYPPSHPIALFKPIKATFESNHDAKFRRQRLVSHAIGFASGTFDSASRSLLDGQPKKFDGLEVIQANSSSTWPSITVPPILLPRYNHIFTLFLALMLSITLAFFSALDATIQCTSIWDEVREGNDDYDNYQQQQIDDYFETRQAEAQKCTVLFLKVIVPVFPLIILLCFIACVRTLHDDRRWGRIQEDVEPPTVVTMTGEENDDEKRLDNLKDHVKNQAKHLKSCYKLLGLSLICLMLCTYAQVSIAAQSNEEEKLYYYDVYYNDAQPIVKMEFLSLGTINALGEVGQNANLYYTSWISLGLSITLVYALTRMAQVQRSTTRTLSAELVVITRHMEGQTTAVETMMEWTEGEKKFIYETRK